MSRPAIAKSRAEKARTNIPIPAPSVNVQQTVEIVPGRFTEADWLSMVAIEEGEEYIGEIMDDLMSMVMKNCYEVYLQQQRIPYTISQAKDATIQIIEWRFLVRDTGEACVARDDTWQEEKEPVSGITDSWAQGTVPVIHTTFIPHMEGRQVSLDESGWMNLTSTPIISTEECKLLELSASQPMSLSLDEDSEENILEKISMIEQLEEEKSKEFKSSTRLQEIVYQPAPPAQEHKPKQENKLHLGSLQSAGLKSITKSLETSEKELLTQELSQTLSKEESQEDLSSSKQPFSSSQEISKFQLGKPSHKKEVVYDEFGNVISVPKIDPSRLPVPCFQPQVEILASYMETERQRLSFPGKLKSKKVSTKTPGHMKGETIKDRSAFQQPSSTEAVSKQVIKVKSNVPISLKSGILLETMQLAPGVILRDTSIARSSSYKDIKQDSSMQEEYNNKESERGLKPILTSVPTPNITVDQLLKNHTPQVQPITRFQTLPSSVRGHS